MGSADVCARVWPCRGAVLHAVIASNSIGERDAAGEWVIRGREASRVACGTDSKEYKMYDEFHQRHTEEQQIARLFGHRSPAAGAATRREHRRQQNMRQ